MYGKYASLVASAYWRRADALSDLGESAKAAEVLRELVKREDLREFPEWRQARDRVAELPEPAPEPDSAGAGSAKSAEGEEVGR